MRISLHARLRLTERFQIPFDKTQYYLDEVALGIEKGIFKKIKIHYGNNRDFRYWPGNGSKAYKCMLPNGDPIYAVCRDNTMVTILDREKIKAIKKWRILRSSRMLESYE